jgi:2-polyprenyl-3-methyl-5-hydroxy-6-metoxy-1,4-benzoquinol methylase
VEALGMQCPNFSLHQVEKWSCVPDWEYSTSVGEHFEYLICKQCDIIFLENPPIHKLQEIYPSNYYSFDSENYSLLYKIKFAFDRMRFRRILTKLNFDSISVLDIGGGVGELLTQIRLSDKNKKIDQTTVIDLDIGAQEKARELGHNYVLSRFEDWDSKETYEIILAFNILEHVENPGQFLAALKQKLKVGGVAIIQTPNIGSIDARIFRRHYWGGLHAPRHFYLFSKNSLLDTLKTNGFNIIDHKFIPAGPFWSFSVLSFFTGSHESLNGKPLYERLFYSPLVAIFSAFDLLRLKFFQTSQQVVVIENRKNVL